MIDMINRAYHDDDGHGVQDDGDRASRGGRRTHHHRSHRSHVWRSGEVAPELSKVKKNELVYHPVLRHLERTHHGVSPSAYL